jgi:hypothetical protein
MKSASMKALTRVQTPINAIIDNKEAPQLRSERDIEKLLEMDDDSFQRVLVKRLTLRKEDEDDGDEDGSIDCSLGA